MSRPKSKFRRGSFEELSWKLPPVSVEVLKQFSWKLPLVPVEVLKQFVLNFHQTSSQTSFKVLRNLASEHCPPKWVYLSCDSQVVSLLSPCLQSCLFSLSLLHMEANLASCNSQASPSILITLKWQKQWCTSILANLLCAIYAQNRGSLPKRARKFLWRNCSSAPAGPGSLGEV